MHLSSSHLYSSARHLNVTRMLCAESFSSWATNELQPALCSNGKKPTVWTHDPHNICPMIKTKFAAGVQTFEVEIIHCKRVLKFGCTTVRVLIIIKFICMAFIKRNVTTAAEGQNTHKRAFQLRSPNSKRCVPVLS